MGLHFLYSVTMFKVINCVIVSLNVLRVHVHKCGKVCIHSLHRLPYDFKGAIWQVRARCQMCPTEVLLFTFSVTFRERPTYGFFRLWVDNEEGVELCGPDV